MQEKESETFTPDQYPGYFLSPDSCIWTSSETITSDEKKSSEVRRLTIVCKVTCHSDAHVLLSSGTTKKDGGYELVVGAHGNKRSFLRMWPNKTELLDVFHVGELEPPLSMKCCACALSDACGCGKVSRSQWSAFWITLTTESGPNGGALLAVGPGLIPEVGTISLLYRDKRSISQRPIKSVFVSTGYGSESRWKTLVTYETLDAQKEDAKDEKSSVLPTLNQASDSSVHMSDSSIQISDSSVQISEKSSAHTTDSSTHTSNPSALREGVRELSSPKASQKQAPRAPSGEQPMNTRDQQMSAKKQIGAEQKTTREPSAGNKNHENRENIRTPQAETRPEPRDALPSKVHRVYASGPRVYASLVAGTGKVLGRNDSPGATSQEQQPRGIAHEQPLRSNAQEQPPRATAQGEQPPKASVPPRASVAPRAPAPPRATVHQQQPAQGMFARPPRQSIESDGLKDSSLLSGQPWSEPRPLSKESRESGNVSREPGSASSLHGQASSIAGSASKRPLSDSSQFSQDRSYVKFNQVSVLRDPPPTQGLLLRNPQAAVHSDGQFSSNSLSRSDRRQSLLSAAGLSTGSPGSSNAQFGSPTGSASEECSAPPLVSNVLMRVPMN